MEKPYDKHYRFFDHTADLGMEIFGADAADLFANAGRALFDVLIHPADHPGQGRHRHTIDVQGEGWADLMVNWLRELLYLWNGEQQILHHLHIVSLSQNRLQATATTVDFLADAHRIDKEIKAVTYHQVEVGPHGNRWRARVIFDV